MFKRKFPVREWKGLSPKLFHRKRSQNSPSPLTLTLNLTHLTFDESSGFGIGMRARDKAKGGGGKFRVRNQDQIFCFFLIGFGSPNLCILSWVRFGSAILFSFLFFISLGSNFFGFGLYFNNGLRSFIQLRLSFSFFKFGIQEVQNFGMVQQNISLLLGLSHSDSSIMGLKKCLVYRIFRGSSKFFHFFFFSLESNFKDS